MSDNRQQATQDPTAQRLRTAEREGRFARSNELATALTWLGSVALIGVLGAGIVTALKTIAVSNFQSTDVTTGGIELIKQQFTMGRSMFWKATLPLLGGFAAVALIARATQSGFRFFPNLAAPDIGRISPRRNLARLFDSQQLITVGLGLLKLVVLMAVAAWILLGDIETLIDLGRGSMSQNAEAFGQWLIAATLRLCAASAAIGLADYAIRWQLHRRSLKMTEQEIRDEQRSMEPSPEVTARRRLMQRQ